MDTAPGTAGPLSAVAAARSTAVELDGRDNVSVVETAVSAG